MHSRLWLSFFIWLMGNCFLSAQSPSIRIFDQQVAGKEIYMISLSGEVTGTIPTGHRPQFTGKKSFIGPFAFNSYNRFDFANGLLPINTPEGSYLMDAQGRRVTDLENKYRMVTPGGKNVYRGFVPNPARKGSEWVVFFDEKGQLLFNDEKFYKATPFNDGFAVVQKEDRNGPWLILEKESQKFIEFNSELAKYIQSCNGFKDGLCLVTLKRPRGYDPKAFVYQKIYFDTNGNLILDVARVTGTHQDNSPHDFRHGLAYTFTRQQYYYFNKEGELLHKEPRVMAFGGISDKHLIINRGDGLNVLLDRNFEEVTLPSTDTEFVNSKFLREGCIGATVYDTLSKSSFYRIYDASSHETLYESKKDILGIEKNRVLIGKKINSFTYKLIGIEDFDGNTIYTLDPSFQLFSSLDEAMEFKDQVQSLQLHRPQKIDRILSFPNLKNLSLSYLEEEALPSGLSNMSKLEKLSVSYSESITSLPIGLAKLTNLTEIQINDCPKLTGLEDLIQKMPQLRLVHTSNYEFPKGFEKQMSVDNPKLVINSWHTMGSDTIIEEEVITPPRPVKPPPAKKN